MRVGEIIFRGRKQTQNKRGAPANHTKHAISTTLRVIQPSPPFSRAPPRLVREIPRVVRVFPAHPRVRYACFPRARRVPNDANIISPMRNIILSV